MCSPICYRPLLLSSSLCTFILPASLQLTFKVLILINLRSGKPFKFYWQMNHIRCMFQKENTNRLKRSQTYQELCWLTLWHVPILAVLKLACLCSTVIYEKQWIYSEHTLLHRVLKRILSILQPFRIEILVYFFCYYHIVHTQSYYFEFSTVPVDLILWSSCEYCLQK